MKLIKNFSQHINEISKMNSLIQPSDQEIEDAEKYLEKGSDPSWDPKFGHFYIDVSGKYSVYLTLWRFNPSIIDTYHFITNLSTDFKTAIEKAKKAAGRVPVIIDKYGTKAGMFKAAKAEILSFGKYRGSTLGDVFISNPKYILYLAQNYVGKMSEKIQYYKNLYFETITKKNQETSPSRFIGEIDKKITIEADIYDVKKTISDYNGKTQYECKLKDNDGNKFKTFNIGREVKIGDDITLTAKVKDHKELLGVKFTILYFCKITRLSNINDDTEKYNI